jgi:hypothetical protein
MLADARQEMPSPTTTQMLLIESPAWNISLLLTHATSIKTNLRASKPFQIPTPIIT